MMINTFNIRLINAVVKFEPDSGVLYFFGEFLRLFTLSRKISTKLTNAGEKFSFAATSSRHGRSNSSPNVKLTHKAKIKYFIFLDFLTNNLNSTEKTKILLVFEAYLYILEICRLLSYL